jgi:exopolysaccharide production protein ExoQ
MHGKRTNHKSLTSRLRPRNGVTSATTWVADDGYALLLAALFWTTFLINAPTDLEGLSRSVEGTYDPNSLTRAIKLVSLGVSCLMILRRLMLARDFSRYLNPGLVAFLVLAPLSTLWSIAPANTGGQSVTFATFVISCFAFGLASWHPRRFQQVALPPLMLIMVGSLALGVVRPDLVTEQGTTISLSGAWHGLTHGKNELGILASTAVILCMHAWISREGRWAWAILGAATALTCLILSRSDTSMFATGVAVLSMLLLLRVPFTRDRYTTIVVALSGLLIGYELIIQNVIPGLGVLLQPITSLTGKGTDFSGRSVIWGVIKDHIALNPFFGGGYGAYWIGPMPESPSYIFLQLMGQFYPSESHNGYLEVLNDLGLAGFVCLVVFLFSYIRQSLKLMRADRNQATLFLALLFQQLVLNMSESVWFTSANMFAIFGFAAVMLSRARFDADLRGRR